MTATTAVCTTSTVASSAPVVVVEQFEQVQPYHRSFTIKYMLTVCVKHSALPLCIFLILSVENHQRDTYYQCVKRTSSQVNS